MKVIFNPSGITPWGHISSNNPESFDENIIKKTNQLFMADYDFAYKMGGPFVRSFLEFMPRIIPHGYNWVIDSKVHMLKPGWYPGIPGWHLDFAPGWENIVNFSKVDVREQHFCAISHGHSRTEFLNQPIELNVFDVPKINGLLSKQVDALYPHLRKFNAYPGTIYKFSQLDLHRVTGATSSGWRLFVRASITKLRKPVNEIRNVGSQVYILADDEHSGW